MNIFVTLFNFCSTATYQWTFGSNLVVAILIRTPRQVESQQHHRPRKAARRSVTNLCRTFTRALDVERLFHRVHPPNHRRNLRVIINHRAIVPIAKRARTIRITALNATTSVIEGNIFILKFFVIVIVKIFIDVTCLYVKVLVT